MTNLWKYKQILLDKLLDLGKDIETGIVCYDDRNGVYVARYDNIYCNTLFDITMHVNKNVWLEVIGNIHDNPEILEVSDNGRQNRTGKIFDN